MALGQVLQLTDGRLLGFDDAGDPQGIPVLFVHGTPDSRRARHPDDGIAAELGIRLLATDRPGIGLSSAHPTSTLGSFADDVVALARHLGIVSLRPFAWSAGAPFAAAVAARHPDLVPRAAIAAGLVPFLAYSEPGILDDADGGRHMVAELGFELGPGGFAEMTAPMLAPIPCDMALAREHVLESAEPSRRPSLEAIPGAVDAMAAGVVDAVAAGPDGLIRELELQVEAPDVEWHRVTCPVDLWYGAHDTTAPPAFGRWWASRLVSAEMQVIEDAGHLVALTHWREILTTLVG
jgi:pimeloyl-ACP methyl ester carboxylesterase